MAQGITFLPSIYELELSKGDTLKLTGAITNDTDKSIVFTLDKKNVSIDSIAQGNLNLIDYAQFTPADWIILSNDKIQVSSHQTKNFNFEIKLPKNADIKDYYPLILLQNEESKKQADIGVNYKVAVPILVNIKEQTEPAQDFIKITDFRNANNIVTNLNLNLSFGINNLSKNFVKPSGIIKIYDNNGQLLENLPRINDDFKTVLPGQVLSENINWDGAENTFSIIPKFGNYKIQLEVYTDPAEQPVVMESNFFILPIYHIIAAILLIVAAVFIIIRLRKRRINR